MEQREYLIDSAANIMGVSSDTLRFYEKIGLLKTHKRSNGYRYFTDYRRMVEAHTAQEEEQIQLHQQALVRLRHAQKELDKLQLHLNRISLEPLPDAWVVRECASLQDCSEQWFRLSQDWPGMDMLYLYDVFRCQSGFSLSEEPELSYDLELVFEKSCLLFYRELEPQLQTGFDFSCCRTVPGGSCIYAVVPSPSRIPLADAVEQMRRWAEKQGLKPGPVLISDNAIHGTRDGAPVYHLELRIPLADSAYSCLSP